MLGDRSVLYKYANPNLIAVASVDQTHTVLSINLVDAVSGAIVYTAKHERASEPVNLLHCENWVAVSHLGCFFINPNVLFSTRIGMKRLDEQNWVLLNCTKVWSKQMRNTSIHSQMFNIRSML